ncbi:MAG: hypothetical protein ACRDRW_05495 [Pseudonocardiaceae bacterium]
MPGPDQRVPGKRLPAWFFRGGYLLFVALVVVCMLLGPTDQHDLAT